MNTDTEVYFQSPSCCHKYSFEQDKDQCRGLILPRATEQGLLGAYSVILFYINGLPMVACIKKLAAVVSWVMLDMLASPPATVLYS